MNITTQRDTYNRCYVSTLEVDDSEIMIERNINVLLERIRERIVDSITERIMERLGPAIDKAINQALREALQPNK